MVTKKQFGSFQDLVADSELPLLVDFYSPRCGPCHMMAKILDQVNEQFKTQLRVVKINTDNYPQLASAYQIYALPTLVFFKNGQQIDRFEGVIPIPKLTQYLQSFLQ